MLKCKCGSPMRWDFEDGMSPLAFLNIIDRGYNIYICGDDDCDWTVAKKDDLMIWDDVDSISLLTKVKIYDDKR